MSDSPAAARRAGVPAGPEDLYVRIPRLDCRRLCGEACGPIVVPAREWARLEEAAGPRDAGDDPVCPYLDRERGLCDAYAARPLVCRLWGTVETMRCPYGCEPERWLSAEEAAALLEEALRRSGGRVRTAWRPWDRWLPPATCAADPGRAWR